MTNSEVRTRFAPAPTGYLHIGGARTALYNWLYARHHGGKFVLRIEDTDQARSTERSTQAIVDSLQWLGIDWDEGPYHQSRRLERYHECAEELLAGGRAYEEHDPEQGTAVRFRMPPGTTVIDDLVHGEVTIDNATVADFVIRKSDGFPTYNFACVVDDADMGITCIIRGDEHMSNMPKQLAVYRALGLEPPQFAHIPMILGPDGAKLSKRHGATSVLEYRDQGFLPQALANFIALLGWNPGTEQEIMSMSELVEMFTLDRCSKVSSRFDTEKLTWMNSQYLKCLPADTFAELARQYIAAAGYDASALSDETVSTMVELYRERARTLAEIPVRAAYALSDEVPYDEASVRKFLGKPGVDRILEACYEALAGLEEFDRARLESALRSVAGDANVGFGKVAQPVRVAITGSAASPGIFETLELV